MTAWGSFVWQNEIHSTSGQTPNNDFREGLSLGLTQSLAQPPMYSKAERTGGCSECYRQHPARRDAMSRRRQASLQIMAEREERNKRRVYGGGGN